MLVGGEAWVSSLHDVSGQHVRQKATTYAVQCLTTSERVLPATVAHAYVVGVTVAIDEE